MAARRAELLARSGARVTVFAAELSDEFLELRTFESFPGLRRVLHDLVNSLSASSNRFVLTSRLHLSPQQAERPFFSARLICRRAFRCLPRHFRPVSDGSGGLEGRKRNNPAGTRRP